MGDQETLYQIQIKEHLDQEWSDWLDGWVIEYHADGTTILIGPVVDQVTLHGLLVKIRNLGLTLIALGPLN